MAKKPRPSSRPPPERRSQITLTESVGRLVDEVRILRDIFADIREEMNWVTRNGVPHQPVEHVLLKQMAKDPLDPNWNEKLIVERHRVNSTLFASPFDSVALDRIVHDLQLCIEGVAQQQLDVLLSALDEVRAQLVTAIEHAPANGSSNPETKRVDSPPATMPPSPKRLRQQTLF